jgi:predicted DNA-binding ribbon-helix-helix protein
MVTTYVDRVQTGLRIEKRLLKVLKGLAEYHDITLGDLIEGIVLHTFEGKPPFGRESRKKIADLKKVYGLDLTSADAHQLAERE